jgi:hypothetical protein
VSRVPAMVRLPLKMEHPGDPSVTAHTAKAARS